jgi:hypothetical protein
MLVSNHIATVMCLFRGSGKEIGQFWVNDVSRCRLPEVTPISGFTVRSRPDCAQMRLANDYQVHLGSERHHFLGIVRE